MEVGCLDQRKTLCEPISASVVLLSLPTAANEYGISVKASGSAFTSLQHLNVNLPMNSAQRLEKIFTDFRDVTPRASQPNTAPSTIDAWAFLFDRLDNEGEDLDGVAQECALAVRQELQHLTNLLRAKQVPEKLYESHLAALRSITTSRYMHEHWQNVAKRVSSEQITVLQWASFALGTGSYDSVDIDEEIDRLASEVTKLIEDVENGSLPLVLRSFLLRNFRSIRDGLWRYKVTGLDALRTTVQTMHGTTEQEIGELRQSVEDLPQEKRNLWKQANQFLNAVVEVCDKAAKLDGGYALANGARKALGIAFGGE